MAGLPNFNLSLPRRISTGNLYYVEFTPDLLLSRDLDVLPPGTRKEAEELLFMKLWSKPARRTLDVSLKKLLKIYLS